MFIAEETNSQQLKLNTVPLLRNTIFATSGELARRLTVQFDAGELCFFVPCLK
jgi:hypothetical protein